VRLIKAHRLNQPSPHTLRERKRERERERESADMSASNTCSGSNTLPTLQLTIQLTFTCVLCVGRANKSHLCGGGGGKVLCDSVCVCVSACVCILAHSVCIKFELGVVLVAWHARFPNACVAESWKRLRGNRSCLLLARRSTSLSLATGPQEVWRMRWRQMDCLAAETDRQTDRQTDRVDEESQSSYYYCQGSSPVSHPGL